jgi:hypothetical protein
MELESSRRNPEWFHAEREARVQPILITFADAAIDARRGDYESVREEMARFFTLIHAELDRGLGSAFTVSTSAGYKPLVAQHDDLITLLANGGPASAERLAIAYADFRKTIGK